jgi:restriction system protein
MAVWLVRAGSHAEFQDKFLSEKRVYVTWDDLDVNLATLPDRDALIAALEQRYPASKPKKLINHASQIWPFAHEMQKGDWIVLPLKTQRAIQIGELTGDYAFEPAGPSPFFHWRAVKWIGEAVPRSHFGKDLLNTFGAFMTICRVQKNDAEARLQAMRKSGWQPESVAQVLAPSAPTAEADEAADLDLEERARDGIARLIRSRFKGNDLTRLVEGILRTQGYTTWRSPAGADGGADILAGAGPLGFGSPRLVVEVKSEQSPIDRPTVDKLLGSVSKFGANEGLFVSWSGFKNNVQKELAGSFFRVRLWSQTELLDALYEVYDKLDPDLRAELPLKQVWAVALTDEDDDG